MPDQNGWHSSSFLGADGRLRRWHYCAGHDHDELVLDTPEERRAHETACKRSARAAAAKRARDAARARTASLRRINALRAENRELELELGR